MDNKSLLLLGGSVAVLSAGAYYWSTRAPKGNSAPLPDAKKNLPPPGSGANDDLSLSRQINVASEDAKQKLWLLLLSARPVVDSIDRTVFSPVVSKDDPVKSLDDPRTAAAYAMKRNADPNFPIYLLYTASNDKVLIKEALASEVKQLAALGQPWNLLAVPGEAEAIHLAVLGMMKNRDVGGTALPGIDASKLPKNPLDAAPKA